MFISKDDYFYDNTESILFDILTSNSDVYGSCIAYKPILSNSDTILNAPYGWKTNSGLKFKNLGDKDYNFPVWDWYTIPANEARNVWSEPYFDQGGGNALMTTFSVPSYRVLGDTSSFVAVLTIDVSLKWLNEMLSGMKFFESGFAFLISNQGNIISHPDTSLVMKRGIVELARELNDKQFENLAHDMLNGKEGFKVVDKGFFSKKSLVYYSPLQNNSWSLGFVFPQAELYEDLTLLNNRLIIILTLGILLLFIFIVFLSGRITKPIRKLALILSKDSIIKEAIDAILESDEEKALALAKRALDQGIDPAELLSEGFSVGIREMGDLFGRGEVFLPELIMSAEAMKSVTAVLDEAIKESSNGESGKIKGTMVFATVEGDVHDIGKGIVVSLIKTQGIDVIDLGRDVSVDVIIDKAVEVNADIIGTSALLTTTLVEQEKLEEELKNRGLRDRFKTMIGGAPATQRWADKIGADAYGEDAAEAITKVFELLGAS